MKLQEKIDKWAKLEKEIFLELSEKPNSDGNCECNNREIIKVVHEGSHFDEIITICINCGGSVQGY